MTWTEAAHPRNPKGPGGGEFASGGSGPKKTAPAKKAPAARRGTPARGSLSFNGRTGTGYGSPHGDPRVRRIQEALNRLHLTDAAGNPLRVDGKLGPKTTAAVKKWQKAHGMKPDGVVTPTTLAALGKAPAKKRTTAQTRARAAKRTSGRMAGK